MTIDPLRSRQALANLVDNALRYGAGDIRLAARAAGDAVEIDVSDEGAGFPPELVPHAFERFSRGDGARTRGGTGIGLAIVRVIAEAHGGTAVIVSDAVRRRDRAAAGAGRGTRHELIRAGSHLHFSVLRATTECMTRIRQRRS